MGQFRPDRRGHGGHSAAPRGLGATHGRPRRAVRGQRVSGSRSVGILLRASAPPRPPTDAVCTHFLVRTRHPVGVCRHDAMAPAKVNSGSFPVCSRKPLSLQSRDAERADLLDIGCISAGRHGHRCVVPVSGRQGRAVPCLLSYAPFPQAGAQYRETEEEQDEDIEAAPARPPRKRKSGSASEPQSVPQRSRKRGEAQVVRSSSTRR